MRKCPVRLLVFAVMLATLISLLVTPGALTGTFFFRSWAETVVVGPPDGIVASDPALLELAFEQAAARHTMTIPNAATRLRMFSPG